MVLGSVWSQTITPLHHKKPTGSAAVWSHSSLYIEVPLSATHRWHVLCAILWRSLHPTCMDGVTGRGHPSAGWLSGFCPHSYYGDYSTEYWGSQWTMKPLFSKYNQHTVYLEMHAYSYKDSHRMHMHIWWLSETALLLMDDIFPGMMWVLISPTVFIHLLFVVKTGCLKHIVCHTDVMVQ